jgi:hypothetical protein
MQIANLQFAFVNLQFAIDSARLRFPFAGIPGISWFSQAPTAHPLRHYV